MLGDTAFVPEIHYHIRWANGALDWKRHETRGQAERSAEQLSRMDERYVLEQFDDTCFRCRSLANKWVDNIAQRSWLSPQAMVQKRFATLQMLQRPMKSLLLHRF